MTRRNLAFENCSTELNWKWVNNNFALGR